MNTDDIKKYTSYASKVLLSGDCLLYEVPLEDIKGEVLNLYKKHQLPLLNMFASDHLKESRVFRVHYCFGVPGRQMILTPFITLRDGENFSSLTNEIHELNNYERNIYSFFGLMPEGHPRLKRLGLHDNYETGVYPLRKSFSFDEKLPVAETRSDVFSKVGGEGIYELPVGPVHAGIIEPGHFRFSLSGEEVVLLEASLGYKHRGAEKLFENLPDEKKLLLSERVCGDSGVNHSLAFCLALEQLSGTGVPKRADYLRVIFAELERIANRLAPI